MTLAATHDPFTPQRVHAADQAWAVYQTARRRVWIKAPHLERQYLRSHDASAYIHGRRLVTLWVDRATRCWLAAIRKIFGRDAWVEPLGTTHLGMPQCFLVRVPKPGRRSLVVAERRWGEPPLDDAVGVERLAHEKLARKQRALAARHEDTHATYYRKMEAALRQSRVEMALKARYYVLREAHARGDNTEHWSITAGPWGFYTRQANKAHSRARDYAQRAILYHGKLKGLGFDYDFATIDTPFTLPEEEGYEPDSRPAAPPAAPHQSGA